MADRNETVEISYKADLKDLLNNLKKIPGVTASEATKMVKQLDRQLKQAEKAAKRSSHNVAKSMDHMNKATNRVSVSARGLRKDFANIDRLSSEASQALMVFSPALGEAAASASTFAGAAESAGRALMVGNPLFLAAAAAAGIAFVAYQAFTEHSTKLSEQSQKLNKVLRESQEELLKQEEAGKIASQSFQAVINQTESLRNQIRLLNGEISEADFKRLGVDAQVLKTTEALTKERDKQINALLMQRSALLDIQKAQEKQFDMVMQDRSTSNKERQKLSMQTRKTASEIETINQKIRDTQKDLNEQIRETEQENRKLLEQKIKIEESEKRSEQSQKRINERLKEYDKLLNDVLKPLSQVEGVLKESLSSQVQQLSISENLQKERLKIEEATLKTEIKKADLFEKQLLLQDLRANREQQITNEARKQIQSLDEQRKNIEANQNSAALELERARAILESEEQSLKLIKSKKEQKEKLLKLEEALEELSEKEGMFAKQQETDSVTLQQLEQNRFNVELNAIEQINQLRQENHELETQRQEQLKNQIKTNLSEALQFSLKIAGDLNSIGNKFAQASIEQLNQQINIVNAERDKAISEVIELEKKGQLTAEQAAERKKQLEIAYAESVKDEQIKIFKTQQQAAIAQAVIDAASAAARAFSDYPFPASLGIAALSGAAAAKQIQVIKAQQPPTKFDMGGMIGTNNSPDSVRINALKGEAILDRATVNRLGGEEGVRALQEGSSPSVIVIQPFRHFDRFVRQASRAGTFGNRKASGSY